MQGSQTCTNQERLISSYSEEAQLKADFYLGSFFLGSEFAFVLQDV
jgi:hypothetical protein